MARYLAFLLGMLILLWAIFINKGQDNQEKLKDTHYPIRAVEKNSTPPVTEQDQNTAVANSVATPASTSTGSTQLDPFKAFLEAHKIQPPPANIQLAPKTPQEIRDVFKAAVEKDISSAYPFAPAQNQKNADRDK